MPDALFGVGEVDVLEDEELEVLGVDPEVGGAVLVGATDETYD